MNEALIALGSNQQKPALQLEKALSILAAQSNITITHRSPWYITKPEGYKAQPDFLNGCIKVITSLPAHELLYALLGIEVSMGRVRTRANAPRVIDLDLLAVGSQVIHNGTLILPHPRLSERVFVLKPLCDIAPDYLLPDGKTPKLLYDALDVEYRKTVVLYENENSYLSL